MAENYTSSMGEKSVKNQVKEATAPVVQEIQGKAVEAKEQVQSQAKEAAEARKSQAVNELNAVAQVLRTSSREMGDQDRPAVANYTEQMAEQLERVSHYIEERDVSQLLSEAADFARRRPEIFLGGAFMVGVMLGRFLSSSDQTQSWPESTQPVNIPRPPTPDYTPPSHVRTYNEPKNFAR